MPDISISKEMYLLIFLFVSKVSETGEITDHTQTMLTDILRALSSNNNAENITQVLMTAR